MFFLRCAFWLSVVYASMSWPNEKFQMPALGSHLIEMGHIETQGLATKAVAGIGALCSRHREECIAEAARLTSLVAANASAPTLPIEEARALARAPVPHSRRPPHDAKLHAAP